MNEQQQRALKAGLEALAATTRHAGASPRVEEAVLAEMRRAAVRRPRGRRWQPVAAALIFASASGIWLARNSNPQVDVTITPAGFVGIPGASVLPPFESGAIVRVALPVSALPSYGIPINPETGAGSVEAELLIAQDGYPRAIRLVTETDSGRSTP